MPPTPAETSPGPAVRGGWGGWGRGSQRWGRTASARGCKGVPEHLGLRRVSAQNHSGGEEASCPEQELMQAGVLPATALARPRGDLAVSSLRALQVFLEHLAHPDCL